MFKKISLVVLVFVNLLFANTTVVLETTKGKIELELLDKIAPRTVKNFTTHIKNGYYNGIIFHRIIKRFMIQTGDPSGTGRGGKSIWGKPFKDEFASKHKFNKVGILAMANRGPNTNGSQFFITTAVTPWLNGKHTIFGYVKDRNSYKVVKALERVKTNKMGKPFKEEKIIKAYINR